jgi:hypothetical protein
MSPVTEMDECPSMSATALMWTPASSQPTAALWRSVWTPPSTPAALAASSMTPAHRSAFDVAGTASWRERALNARKGIPGAVKDREARIADPG